MLIHKFGKNDIRKTTFNVNASIEANDYIINSKNATDEDIELFNEVQTINSNQNEEGLF